VVEHVTFICNQLRVKRRDEAVLQAQNAVQQDPESFLAKWELACAYHWNGQHEEAIAIFEPLWANSGTTA
jgi:Tfp pilus assembly protein PilF